MTVTLISAIHTRRKYLDREALKIAADVRGASRSNVQRYIYLTHKGAGIDHDAALDDADLCLRYLDYRLTQIAAIRASAPSPREIALWG